MAIISYRDALNQGLAEELQRDPNVVLMGEEVAQFKGSYKVSEGLLEKFGPSRIIDTPISEAAFSGLAVGASMMGMRPVVEFMFWSFCYVAFDQIFNNAANVRYMSGGLINVPVVFDLQRFHDRPKSFYREQKNAWNHLFLWSIPFFYHKARPYIHPYSFQPQLHDRGHDRL